MLAQNLMTAEELGIEEIEFDALRTVMGMLERGEMTHVPTGLAIRADGFNMGYWREDTDLFSSVSCGTVACIGGWCQLVSKQPVFESYANTIFEGENKALDGLFYPMTGLPYDSITPSQAAQAIRSYLTTGQARWAEALGEQ